MLCRNLAREETLRREAMPYPEEQVAILLLLVQLRGNERRC